MKNNEKEHLGVTFLWFFGVVLAANLWAYFYVTNSRFIYSWDNTLYWSAAKSLSEYRIDGSFFKMMYESIGNSEYNMLPALLPAFIMKLFSSTSRLIFIMSLVNLYYVPTVLIIFLYARHYFKRAGLGATLLALAQPIMLFIGLVGFSDMGAVFFALLAMLTFFSGQPDKNMIFRYFLCSVLLIFSMLFRRYFAFFALSFVTAATGSDIIYGRKKIGIAVMALTFAVILIAGFRDFLTNQLLRDYRTLYSGYKFSVITDVKLICRYFGIIPIAFLLLSSIRQFFSGKNPIFVFLWLQIIVCFIMFSSTQTHGQQHLLLYVPSIIMLIFHTVPKEKNPYFKFIAVFLALVIPINTLIWRKQPSSLLEIKHFALIPDFSMRERINENADDILAVKKYLNEVVGIGETVGVLASGIEFNGDMLKNCETSLGISDTREDFFVNLPQVDSRDLDLSPLFETDFMVVAYPAQTHLGKDRQRVITEAVRCFSKNEGFAKAFINCGESFRVGELDVLIYRRTRSVKDEEKSQFLGLFT